MLASRSSKLKKEKNLYRYKGPSSSFSPELAMPRTIVFTKKQLETACEHDKFHKTLYRIKTPLGRYKFTTKA